MSQAPQPPDQCTNSGEIARQTPGKRGAYIRSYVRRQGRTTRAQAKALTQLWPRYGIPHTGPVLDLAEVFERSAPTVLEIGFGNGEVLAQAALQSPETNFLGIEIHRPGLGALLMRLEEHNVSNVRVMDADAVDILRERIPAASLDAIWIFFPDPWPKARHRKRRLLCPPVAELLSAALKLRGVLHAATDWEDYAKQMLTVLDDVACLANTAGAGQFSARPEWRPKTRFEARGLTKGHEVYDLIYRKTHSGAD